MNRFLSLSLFVLSAACAPPEENAQPDPGATPSGPRDTPPARATRVEVATLNSSKAELVIDLPGEVEASRDANLSAPLGGFVERVLVTDGDVVKKGQVLAYIDAATHGARQNQAKVEVDNARREYERQQMLGSSTPRAQLEAAESRYLAAKAAHRVASVSVARSVIRAPFAGKLARVDVEEGETAGPGAPLMRLIRLDPIKVTMSLSDRDVINVKEGMKAMVGTGARSSRVEGTVKLVQPAADTNTRSFIAEIEVPNPDRTLLPGMIATIQVVADVQGENQLLIHQDWLVTKPDSLGVFVHRDGAAAWRPVTLGAVVRNQVFVTDGLETGAELVIRGHRELADGDRLLVARKGVCCTEGRVVFGTEGAAGPNRPAKAPPPASSAPSP
ncbi:MAG: efflux RND transporter periplasmic adaptor subunit [Myxococcota bacterium]